MKAVKDVNHSKLTLVFILVTRSSFDAPDVAVRIPFRFCVGGRECESGRYLVRLDKDVIRLSAENFMAGCDCAVVAVRKSNSATGTLVFVECGGRYLLSKTFWPVHDCDRLKDHAGSLSRRVIDDTTEIPVQTF